MSNYLGKISAIVSANTAGYVRSLNDAASQTRDFAKTIRSDITRSSNDAGKAFNSILSPLQKLQRALDAASSQRLSFKGVEGAINNVKQLRQQINEIRDLQLAVRITGAAGIDDLRENLRSLSSTDIQAAVQVTGSEDVEQLQRRLNKFSDRTVNLLTRASGVENIDQLAEKVDSLSDRELRLSVAAINENAIERAKRQLEQLTSASAEIAKPLAAANRQLTGFSAEIQTALLPGFSQVQKAALQLEQDIRAGAEIGEDRYTRLRSVVERAAAAIAAVGDVDVADGAQLERLQQSLAGIGELRINADTQELQRAQSELEELRAAASEVQSGETRLRVNAEAAIAASGSLKELSQEQDRLESSARDSSSELSKLDARIDELRKSTEGFPELRLQVTEEFDKIADKEIELERLRQRAEELYGRKDEEGLSDEDRAVDFRRDALREELEREGPAFYRRRRQLQQMKPQRRELEALEQQRVEIEARVVADQQSLERVRREIEDVGATREVRLAANFVDLTSQINAAKSQIAELTNNPAAVGFDATEALAEINLLENEIEALEANRATIRAEFDNAAQSEVDEFEAKIREIEARKVEIEARLDTEGVDEGIRKLEEAAQQANRQAAEQRANTEVGAGTDATDRQLSKLAQSVSSVRGQIDQLPASIATEFIPQLQRAEQEFVRLRTSGKATAEEIENASSSAAELAAQVRRVGTAQNLGSFASGLDDTALRGAIGNLQALQQILNRVGATAGSAGARQFDRLRSAIQRATRDGTIGSREFQKELEEISQEAARAAAATGKIGKSAAFREIKRGGDIARGGFDKISLATQQAAFAIDDFFSATGDFTQKIRAVQNNVTQLAFILGGTTGLFVGLGVAIAAQAAVALFKFFNETEKAKFGAEFLNEELEKTKSLAEQNADAFRDLADAVAQAGSGFGANAARFQIDETLRQQREARREQAEQNIVTTSPRIIEAEAEVRRLEQRLEDATTTEERAAASIELGRARRDARVTRRAVLTGAGQSSFDGGEVQRALQRARDAELERVSALRNPFFSDRRRELENNLAIRPQTADQAVAEIDRQISSLQEALGGSNALFRLFGGGTEIEQQIEDLREERGRLQFQIEKDINGTLEEISRGLLVSTAEIEGTLQGLSNLGLDADIVSPLADEIAAQAKTLRQAQRDAERAAEVGGDDGKRLAEEAQKRSEEAREALAETFVKIDDLARRVALGAEVSIGQRLKGALDQVGDLGPSIVETSLRRAQAELEQIDRQRQRAVISGDDEAVERLDQQRDALRQQTAGLEESAIALQSFQSAVEDAALALVDTLVREAQQVAEQARRDANTAVGEGSFDAEAAQRQAEAARQRQFDAQRQRVEVDNQIRQERLRLEQEAADGTGDQRNAELSRRIRLGNRRANDASLTAQQRETARADAAIAQSELDERLANDPSIRAIRADADRADQERARREQEARQSREQASNRASALGTEVRDLQGVSRAAGVMFQLSALKELEEDISEVNEAIERAGASQSGASQELRDELDRLEEEADDVRRDVLFNVERRQKNVLGTLSAQSAAAERELSQAGVQASDVQGKIVEQRLKREDLVRRRDAITGNDEESQQRRQRLQGLIDNIDIWSDSINAAAIAVAGFQKAAEDAALSLQRSVTSERERAAEQSRRRANEAEALFGEDSDFTREARDRQQRDEQAAADAQASQREAERTIAAERAAFEQELRRGENREAAKRAERIAELERVAADQGRDTAEREDARAEARRLRDEQDAEFERRPEVQAARRQADEADIALQQRRSADRAFERSRTEREQQERAAAQVAGDLRNRFALDNVDPNQQRAEVNATVRSEAQRVAPLLVQFAEQRQNARLQGPSRAALQAQSITTSQGASELNRLLRGDDSARDVNLVELKKQTSQLDLLIRKIEEATGVVATVDS